MARGLDGPGAQLLAAYRKGRPATSRGSVGRRRATRQPLAAEMVAHPSGAQLTRAPDGRIGSGQEPDFTQPEPVSGEEGRKKRPRQAAVEVVHHPRLAR